MMMMCSPSTRENNAFQSSGIQNEHGTVRKHELNVAWVARHHGISWHWDAMMDYVSKLTKV
uniref:Uncharacterized protein n=1 Tax=Romanomermis culicivorax TaxID=13658 RepID=A0A915I299_ROMCU